MAKRPMARDRNNKYVTSACLCRLVKNNASRLLERFTLWSLRNCKTILQRKECITFVVSAYVVTLGKRTVTSQEVRNTSRLLSRFCNCVTIMAARFSEYLYLVSRLLWDCITSLSTLTVSLVGNAQWPCFLSKKKKS